MTLAAFNAAPADEAVATMLACCGSRRFAQAMAAGRPYPSADAAVAAVDVAFESLTWSDVLEAMDRHPRIGARVAASRRRAVRRGRRRGGARVARAASRRPSSPA